ncbi:hypothetical protein GJAV_G00028630, partial [Gymnothorax javanicus]
MDAVCCRGETVINEEDSSQLASIEAQLMLQDNCQGSKVQVPKHLISCDDCDQTFIELSGLLRHKQTEHTLRKPHRCHACGQEFALLSSLQLHKHSNATLNCQFCKQVFQCSTSLASHLLQQHGALPASPELEGQSCNYLFNHHDGGPYACAPCGKNFRQKPALLHHQQAGCYKQSDSWIAGPHTGNLTVSSLTPQAPTPPPLPTSPAGITLTSLPSTYLPPSPIRPHVCSLCPGEFRSRAGLACHQRLRHPLEWKRAQSKFWKLGGDRFPCPSCDKVFCHSVSLYQHQARCHKVVTRRRRTMRRCKSQCFPCSSCDMVFSQASKLYLHRKEQHQSNDENVEQSISGAVGQSKSKETHSCDACNKVLPDPLSYWAHVKTHHGLRRQIPKGKMVCEPDKKRVANGRLFQCPQCDKTYRHRCNLSRHLHAHSKIREKSDRVAGRSDEIGGGPAGTGLKKRVKGDLEHKECPEKEDDGTFPCPSCEEVFSLQSALKEHEEVHQSLGGVQLCSVCGHDMDFFRRTSGKVAGFYHCVPCKQAFHTLCVFLQHCQKHLVP